MTTILIPATSHSPQITLEDIRAAGGSSADMIHMRDMINNCASQVGREKCASALAELDRLESEYDR